MFTCIRIANVLESNKERGEDLRKIPYIFATLLLAACTDGGTPTCVGPNGACGFDGLTPDKNRFIDNAATSNRRINMMIALNDAQVGKYIQHRLIG